jgi:hypothetical protein
MPDQNQERGKLEKMLGEMKEQSEKDKNLSPEENELLQKKIYSLEKEVSELKRKTPATARKKVHFDDIYYGFIIGGVCGIAVASGVAKQSDSYFMLEMFGSSAAGALIGTIINYVVWRYHQK